MRAEIATLDWPAEDVFGSEEQDEQGPEGTPRPGSRRYHRQPILPLAMAPTYWAVGAIYAPHYFTPSFRWGPVQAAARLQPAAA